MQDLSDSKIANARRELGTFEVAIDDSSVVFVNSTRDVPAFELNDKEVTLRSALLDTRGTEGATIVVPDEIYALRIPGEDEDNQ